MYIVHKATCRQQKRSTMVNKKHLTAVHTLTSLEQQEYKNLLKQVQQDLRHPNGLVLLLNAIIAAGPDTTRDDIKSWIEVTEEATPNNECLRRICYGDPSYGPDWLPGVPKPAPLHE